MKEMGRNVVVRRMMIMTTMSSFKAFMIDIFLSALRPGIYFVRNADAKSMSLIRSKMILRDWKAIIMTKNNMNAELRVSPSFGIRVMIARALGIVTFMTIANTNNNAKFKMIRTTRFLISSANVPPS